MRKGPTIAAAATIVAVLVLVSVGVYVNVRSVTGQLALPTFTPECRVTAQGQVDMDAAQLANAATIAAVGVRRRMPERAVVVALATALQESSLENIPYGDRDSVGLFQQRPSQGWGSPEELNEPRTAASKFYTSLKKVPDWESMRVTEAAQRVQRSAYPEAYEKWADDAAVLARGLLGTAGGAVTCTPREPDRRGADALVAALTADWGKPAIDRAPDGLLTVQAADPQAAVRVLARCARRRPRSRARALRRPGVDRHGRRLASRFRNRATPRFRPHVAYSVRNPPAPPVCATRVTAKNGGERAGAPDGEVRRPGRAERCVSSG